MAISDDLLSVLQMLIMQHPRITDLQAMNGNIQTILTKLKVSIESAETIDGDRKGLIHFTTSLLKTCQDFIGAKEVRITETDGIHSQKHAEVLTRAADKKLLRKAPSETDPSFLQEAKRIFITAISQSEGHVGLYNFTIKYKPETVRLITTWAINKYLELFKTYRAVWNENKTKTKAKASHVEALRPTTPLEMINIVEFLINVLNHNKVPGDTAFVDLSEYLKATNTGNVKAPAIPERTS